jgi:hypothetical protein
MVHRLLGGMDLLRRIASTREIRVAAVVLGCGIAPLLLYILFERAAGQSGGNPIGLGLLFALSVPVALILFAVGLVRALVAHWRSE